MKRNGTCREKDMARDGGHSNSEGVDCIILHQRRSTDQLWASSFLALSRLPFTVCIDPYEENAMEQSVAGDLSRRLTENGLAVPK
jgi:hypothetical protein